MNGTAPTQSAINILPNGLCSLFRRSVLSCTVIDMPRMFRFPLTLSFQAGIRTL